MPFIREGSSVFSMLFDASGAGTRQSNLCDDMKGVGLGCRVSKACGWLRMCRPLQAGMDSRTSGNTRKFDYLEERFMRVAHHVALLCSGSSGSRLVLSWGWIIIIRLLVPYTMFLAEYEAIGLYQIDDTIAPITPKRAARSKRLTLLAFLKNVACSTPSQPTPRQSTPPREASKSTPAK